MNTKYARMLLCLLLMAGCKKEKYTCEYNIYYIRPLSMAFAGFTAAELDTVIVSSYTGNTGMTDLIRTDTILSTAPLFRNDVAYAPDSTGPLGYVTLKNNTDYRVRLISTSREFTVTGARGGPTFHQWTQETRCSPGSGDAHVTTLLDVHVDGVEVYPSTAFNYDHFIILRK